MREYRFAMNADVKEFEAEVRRLLGLKKGEEIVKPSESEPETGSGWDYFRSRRRG